MKDISYEKNGFVGLLRLERPERLNALSSALLGELSGLLDELKSDDALRCLIVTGAGEKAFVAGADISEMAGFSAAEALEYGRYGNAVMAKLAALEVPVIAAVNGYALGGGCELALSCDIRLASERAVFGFPETSLGIIPGFGGTVRLARAVGESRAREMIFSGVRIKAQQALEWGLVSEVCPNAELLPRAHELAEMIVANAPIAVRAAKKSIDAGRFDFESECFAGCFDSEDRKNAMEAFLNRTATPPFENR